MPTQALHSTEIWSVVNGLRTAADKYESIAAKLCDARAIQGFKDQAAQARELAETFECAVTITIEV